MGEQPTFILGNLAFFSLMAEKKSLDTVFRLIFQYLTQYLGYFFHTLISELTLCILSNLDYWIIIKNEKIISNFSS